jgi:predicted nucleotidyltransferase component of viral defense system
MELNTATHKNHLIKILTSIYKNPHLNNQLGFKGGTAGMLFYDLPRLSVDLDFDLTSDIKKDSPEISNLIKEVTSLLLKEDYVLKDQSTKFNTLFWAASYGAGTKQIKVEISTRKLPCDSYESKNLYGVPVKTSVLPDLIAHKLIALVSRNKFANRDLFDTHYYLSKYPESTNHEIIKHALDKNPEQFYQYLLEFLTKLDTTNLLDGVGQLMTDKQKDWARNSLHKETVGLIQKQLDLKLWEMQI